METVFQNIRRQQNGHLPLTGLTLIIVGVLAMSTMAMAGEADVVEVSITQAQDRTVTFIVTVRHADTGWDHYADRWEVIDPKGNIIAVRTLYHPHVNEQPFTRRLDRVVVPPGIQTVTIRAHDSVHDYGGKQVTVDLKR